MSKRDVGNDVVKAGRRNSASDLERIQAVHDLAAALGATCDAGAAGDDGPPAEAAADDGATTKATAGVVKALGRQRIGGYAVLWGDQGRKDLVGEYFTPETEELDVIFRRMKALPSLYHHGGDAAVKAEVVGQVDVMAPDDVGMWFEAQLLQGSQYREAIDGLIARGALGVSSGTLPLARKAAPDGRILRWPIVEISLTPTPAEFRMMERPVSEIKAAFTALGLEFGDDAAPAAGIALELERLALLMVAP